MHQHTCGLACAWVLCAWLNVRASCRLYVFICISVSIHTPIYTHDVIHTYTVSTKGSDTCLKMNAHQCSFYICIHFQQHTNTCIFLSLHRYIQIYTCLCACYVCMYVCVHRTCVSTCVSACACLSECARLSMHVCASLLGARKGYKL